MMGSIDINLEHVSRYSSQHRIEVDGSIGFRFLLHQQKRSGEKTFVERLETEDYRTLFGHDPFINNGQLFKDIDGSECRRIDLQDRQPDDVEDNLQRLVDAVHDGDIIPPLDREDAPELYDDMATYREQFVGQQYPELDVNEGSERIVITDHAEENISTWEYHFSILERPGKTDAGMGTVEYLGERVRDAGKERYTVSRDVTGDVESCVNTMDYRYIHPEGTLEEREQRFRQKVLDRNDLKQATSLAVLVEE